MSIRWDVLKTNWMFSRRWRLCRRKEDVSIFCLCSFFRVLTENDSLSLFSVSQLCSWKLSDKTGRFWGWSTSRRRAELSWSWQEAEDVETMPHFLFQDKHLSNSTQNCWLITQQSLYRFVQEGWEGPGPEDEQVRRVCWPSFQKSSKMHQVNLQFEKKNKQSSIILKV